MADIEPAPGIAASYAQALGWFEAEWHNLIAAVDLAAAHRAYGVAARLPRTLWPFLDLQARWQEWADTHRTGSKPHGACRTRTARHTCGAGSRTPACA